MTITIELEDGDAALIFRDEVFREDGSGFIEVFFTRDEGEGIYLSDLTIAEMAAMEVIEVMYSKNDSIVPKDSFRDPETVKRFFGGDEEEDGEIIH